MALRFYVVPDFFDFPIWGDKDAAADNPFVGPAHEFLRAPEAIGFDHFVVGVAEKREVKLVLPLKTSQCLNGVRANSKYFHFQFLELLFGVTKLGRFNRSTGSVRLGKEIK